MSDNDDIPSPPWQRARPSRAPRRKPITREAIVQTALELLDRDGVDALSMRKVADELGTGAASLYHHVGNKDELLDLVLDLVIGEFDVPDPEPERWREQVKEVARDWIAGLRRHRDLVKISIGRYPMGPNALVFTDRLLGIFRAGGLPPLLAARGSWLLSILLNGFAIEDGGSLRAVEPEALPDDEALAMVRDYLGSLPPERFPHLTEMADELSSGDPDEAFDLLIDSFIDGLAARAGVD